ncbi:DUF2490 domain-containing protein [Flavobacterium lacus]|uniref:Uncharacterized protein DUF2490 n=1 Tax=Flavobacterium lacus TaxID=1353778 RepID=A0A328WRS8_9FLAO|nr:DUF2490 domain-containing protein [Flavobacterium lacus]RAR48901.1 uncharacterized protein DUF2490 [Flavobacterium lacus]
MKKFRTVFIFMLVVFFNTLNAQNTRIDNRNSIGWYNYFGTLKIAEKWGFHTEYQFRRNELVTEWQQSLLRVGVNYQANKNVQFRLGYAWIETFPYGDIPINGMGKDFTEHRIFQMVTLTDKVSIIDLSHRFILEQRWVGTYSDSNLRVEDNYLFLNRLRYMFRLQIPLKGIEIKDNTPYLAIYDEVFIGFGENVNENVFDQNRIGILLGYQFNSKLKVEAGFLNQIVQLGREVDSRNVFQYNNGFILNAIFNVDLSKKSKTIN